MRSNTIKIIKDFIIRKAFYKDASYVVKITIRQLLTKIEKDKRANYRVMTINGIKTLCSNEGVRYDLR